MAARAHGTTATLAGSLALLVAGGCALVRPIEPVEPLPESAVLAFGEAQLHLRGRDAEALLRAREAALRASRLAPRWVAPRRVVDDVDRAYLLGPELWTRYEERLVAEPDDAVALYLSGRLDDPARGLDRFRRAVRTDPGLASGHHGLSWALAGTGDLRGAVEAERRALERARGSWERSYFSDSLSRHYAAMGKDLQALEVVLRRLDEPDVLAGDHLALSVRAALLELERPYGKSSRSGARRALELLHTGGLTEQETKDLSLALVRAAEVSGVIGSSEIRVALRAVEGPGRDEMLALLLLRERPSPLSLGLLRRALADDPSRLALDPAFRSARFATGEVAAPIEEWLALQPRMVLDAAGLPRDARLARVVELSRAAEERAGDPQRFGAALGALGEALVAAGWFQEAHGLAQELARYDVESALVLDERATAGRALLDSITVAVSRVDRRGGLDLAGVGAGRPAERAAEDLAELLQALEPRFQHFRDTIDPVRRGPRVELSDSPRLRYGPVGSVVHPGPRFSSEDESLGLGREGERVGGLAHELDRIGRFGVFGEAVGGGGPDGTVLRRLLVEERSGEHLGTPWSGTVAWCDGADLLSRPGRRGARIGGAALHEGYWIDVGTLRSEERRFRDLTERFLHARHGVPASRALDVRPAAADLGRSAPGDPRDLPPLLGEADRVRLAVLRERWREGRGTRGGRGADLVPLDELVLATAAHEEGHLCDRTRFLPLSERFFAVVGFFLSSGMSPARVEERLEYRAQLTALCSTPETRLCLAEILAAAEQGTGGVTPHGAAYTRLLRDFVLELDRAVRRDVARFPELDPAAELAHQLHRLDAEQVREVAREVARLEGLLPR